MTAVAPPDSPPLPVQTTRPLWVAEGRDDVEEEEESLGEESVWARVINDEELDLGGEELDTMGSLASGDSAGTVKTGSLAPPSDLAQALPPRKDPLDPAPSYDRGPPFAAGDFVLAHFEPGNRLIDFERGIVLDAAHPHYTLVLESGERRLATHPEVLLMPFRRGPAGQDGAAHEHDVGDHLREERRKLEADGALGSFGMVIDAQLLSLRRAKEAKEHAKAVKADDTAVTEHLWDG